MKAGDAKRLAGRNRALAELWRNDDGRFAAGKTMALFLEHIEEVAARGGSSTNYKNFAFPIGYKDWAVKTLVNKGYRVTRGLFVTTVSW